MHACVRGVVEKLEREGGRERVTAFFVHSFVRECFSVCVKCRRLEACNLFSFSFPSPSKERESERGIKKKKKKKVEGEEKARAIRCNCFPKKKKR